MELALSHPPVDPPIVNGRYRLGRVLGAGGMGTVHEAEHLGLGERVALKLLRPDYAAMPELCERFLREAKSLFRIHHENVVRVLDVDTWTQPGGGPPVPYIVMDFVEGVSVDQLLAKRGRLAYGEAVEIVRQTCEGLGEAHRLGIIHRDVKPHNLMVTSRGDGTATVKLLDFGIAQMDTNAMSTRLTVTAAVIGTPSYMSPEQLRSARAADARSDVWSCGVVLFELLTGQLPWNAASPGDLAVRMYMEPLAARPQPFPADVPAEVAAVVLRCLATEPEARWADATELADALAPFAAVVSDAEIATAGSMRVRANRRTPNPRQVRAPSRPEMTFARQKVHGEDGRTAFELHELVPRHRAGSDVETGPRRPASVPAPALASVPAPAVPASPLQQLSFASLVAIVAGAVGFLVLLLGVLLVVIATRPDGKTDDAKASASATVPSARPASAPISSHVVAPKELAPKEVAPVASAAPVTTEAKTAEKPKPAAAAPTSSATAGERRAPAPKGSSTASFFTDKW